MFKKSVLVVGGSRGIGAAAVRIFAVNGWNVVFSFNKHEKRALKLFDEVGVAGNVFCPLRCDICDAAAVDEMLGTTDRLVGKLDCVVMAASGGLEQDKSESYADIINVEAQGNLVDCLIPRMVQRGKIIYLTSHEAHFANEVQPFGPYAVVAFSKRRGEDLLRNRINSLPNNSDLVLEVVSADLVEGTATAKILEMVDRQAIERHRSLVGRLPTTEDVAAAIWSIVSLKRTASVETTYVWEPWFLRTN